MVSLIIRDVLNTQLIGACDTSAIAFQMVVVVWIGGNVLLPKTHIAIWVLEKCNFLTTCIPAKQEIQRRFTMT